MPKMSRERWLLRSSARAQNKAVAAWDAGRAVRKRSLDSSRQDSRLWICGHETGRCGRKFDAQEIVRQQQTQQDHSCRMTPARLVENFAPIDSLLQLNRA